MAHSEAGAHHSGDDDEGSDDGGASGVEELSEAELEAEREEEDDDAYLRPEVDVCLGGDGGEVLEVWTCEESSDDVAEHDRLLYPLEKYCDDGSEEEDES